MTPRTYTKFLNLHHQVQNLRNTLDLPLIINKTNFQTKYNKHLYTFSTLEEFLGFMKGIQQTHSK